MINIKSDSRKIKKGDIFIALKGISSNGEEYVESAIEKGAATIIVDSDNKYSVNTIKVPDTRKYLNKYLKDNYYKYLSEMNIIGVTGTNGKTTTSYLIYQMLNKLGIKCAYIGTIGFYLDKKVYSLPNTSSDICDLYDMIITSYDNGYRNIVIEVSSQGLSYNRFETIKFDYAIFTNLTQDHLDYHKTMENYALAKKKLFDSLKQNGIGIVNKDDKYYKYYITNNTVYYGESTTDYKIESYNLGYKTLFKLNIKGNIYNFKTNLIGKYNIYNLTAALALLNEMNIDINRIIELTSNLETPPGRMDIVNFKDNLIKIDYANNTDAMENVFDTVNKIKKGKLFTIFGCTGDRDRTKRPIMMKLATINSDKVIVTSDDLHDEDFNHIISDMLKDNTNNNFEIIQDRGEAIKKGISYLREKDLLLILGKGHEEVIIIKDKRIPFNDKKEVEKIINNQLVFENKD